MNTQPGHCLSGFLSCEGQEVRQVALMLEAKALEFHMKFMNGEGSFTASDAWIDRWKKKYDIRQLNIAGETFCKFQHFKQNSKNKFYSLATSGQRFNYDETGLTVTTNVADKKFSSKRLKICP